MREAFTIMQIGNEELDTVYETVIVPAVSACGLAPKRVDKHNEGGLLKNEIISFIERGQIIVADITNERPNCYLEIGYVMGVDKFKNLILTAREDHHVGSAKHKKGGPKVHFDLAGYDILFWDPKELSLFRQDLETRIRRRLALLQAKDAGPTSTWDLDWIKAQRSAAQTPNLGYMELRFSLTDSTINKVQTELLGAVNDANISTSGWPIGVVLNKDEHRPKPRADGIVAEIVSDSGYDYWALRRNGDFYLQRDLFEDTHSVHRKEVGKHIFLNTRISVATEILLFCARLYQNLGVPNTSEVNVGVRIAGLAGRCISASDDRWVSRRDKIATENEIDMDIVLQLSSVESSLVDFVKQLTVPLFALFDFYRPNDKTTYETIVGAFVKGYVI